jgi:hypothetical protein
MLWEADQQKISRRKDTQFNIFFSFRIEAEAYKPDFTLIKEWAIKVILCNDEFIR